MLKENRSNSVTLIRNFMRTQPQAMTLRDIKNALPTLKSSEISMTLCYFLKQRYVVRENVENTIPKERKTVWAYTYNEQRFPVEVQNEG